MKTKAIVIGRHTPDLGDQAANFEIVEVRNMQFPQSRIECQPILLSLSEEAKAGGSVILLQNTPGQVAAALCKISAGLPGYRNIRVPVPGMIGIVISVPGHRQAGLVETFFAGSDYQVGVADIGGEIIRAVQFANGRAKIERIGDCGIEVTVDPVPQFVFSHIEWL